MVFGFRYQCFRLAIVCLIFREFLGRAHVAGLRLTVVPIPLVWYRKHDNERVSTSTNKEANHVRALRPLQNKAKHGLGMSPTALMLAKSLHISRYFRNSTFPCLLVDLSAFGTATSNQEPQQHPSRLHHQRWTSAPAVLASAHGGWASSMSRLGLRLLDGIQLRLYP